MRKSFHQQLSKLWGKEPFSVLKDWEKPGYGPDTIQDLSGTNFLPYYGRTIGIGVELDIRLLTGMPNKTSIIKSGDLDNRVKRIIDALRIPKPNEMQKGNISELNRCYCLLEDDDAVVAIRAKLGTYLSSDDPIVSFVYIIVKPMPLRVTVDNISMLI